METDFKKEKVKFYVSDQFINVLKFCFILLNNFFHLYFSSKLMWKSFLCSVVSPFFAYKHQSLSSLSPLAYLLHSLSPCIFNEKMEIIELELFCFTTIETKNPLTFVLSVTSSFSSDIALTYKDSHYYICSLDPIVSHSNIFTCQHFLAFQHHAIFTLH